MRMREKSFPHARMTDFCGKIRRPQSPIRLCETTRRGPLLFVLFPNALLLMDHFLYRFSTFSEKNLSIRKLTFLRNVPSTSVPFGSVLICAVFSNAT